MPERITKEYMIEHCLNSIRKHPYDRIGLEHFIFMKLLEDCPLSKFEELVKLYQWTIKD